ncbi:MAG: hypothetical protein ACRC7O_02775, partial [Fimbriiglobus sp.]
MTPHPLILARLRDEVPVVDIMPDGAAVLHAAAARPAAVLPGAFHAGHRVLAAGRRVAQFAGVAAVWVTKAAAIETKADLVPGAAY